MAGIRTVMVTTPVLLGDLIKRLMARHIELDIVAEFDERRALARRLQAIQPDLLIIGLRRGESAAAAGALLATVPAAKCIVFSNNGRAALGLELRLYQTDLRDASVDALAAFIRAGSSPRKSRKPHPKV